MQLICPLDHILNNFKLNFLIINLLTYLLEIIFCFYNNLCKFFYKT